MRLSSEEILTPLGGYAILVKNTTGQYLGKNRVVFLDPCRECIILGGVSRGSPLGVVLGYIKRGAYGWVVVSGIAELILRDGTRACRGGSVVRLPEGKVRVSSAKNPPRSKAVGIALEDRNKREARTFKVLLHFL